jgi:hypothetical protein
VGRGAPGNPARFSTVGNQTMETVNSLIKNTYFVRSAEAASDSLHFHEMVHVVQWAKLGVERFLLAYGIGLAQFGYEQSPLKKMAYDLQLEFDQGISRA